MKVCAGDLQQVVTLGPDPVTLPNGAPVYVCTAWLDVTLQVPNTFEVDPVDVTLGVGAVVTTALAFWAIGQGIGSIGRIVRDALRPNIERED